MKAIESPCIRKCCLDDDDICVGCLRHIDEILVWGKASNKEKSLILDRIESRKSDMPLALNKSN